MECLEGSEQGVSKTQDEMQIKKLTLTFHGLMKIFIIAFQEVREKSFSANNALIIDVFQKDNI